MTSSDLACTHSLLDYTAQELMDFHLFMIYNQLIVSLIKKPWFIFLQEIAFCYQTLSR